MVAEDDSRKISRSRFDAVIFDLDGVLARTAKLHARAWKQMFDEFLRHRMQNESKIFSPFEIGEDYLRYVDGKPRYDGVQSFLRSRSIELPLGIPRDSPETETICGLGNRKDKLFKELVEREGVEVHEHAIALVKRLRTEGFKTAVVSSSKSCVPILKSVHAFTLFDAKIDGEDMAVRGLKGEPSPYIFLAAAEALRVAPERAVIVEDALAGVKAGRAGGFGLVIGVDRAGYADALYTNGADLVVADLSELEVVENGSTAVAGISSALVSLHEITSRIRGVHLAVFLDFDGTLTPIVNRPEQAVIGPAVRSAIVRLALLCPVAVISGRDLQDVRARVGVEGIYYAGSHGYDIAGLRGTNYQQPQGLSALPALDAAEQTLRTALKQIDGALVERKRFSIAVHYRLVREEDVAVVKQAVDDALHLHAGLRKGRGKKVIELQPDADWDKGQAVRWLLSALNLDHPDVLPIYIGDDLTDEDAFRALGSRGLGIVVVEHPRETAARYRLRDPGEVRVFLEALADSLERAS